MGYYEGLTWSVPWTLTPIFIDLRLMGVRKRQTSKYMATTIFCSPPTLTAWRDYSTLCLAVAINYGAILTASKRPEEAIQGKLKNHIAYRSMPQNSLLCGILIQQSAQVSPLDRSLTCVIDSTSSTT